jgi:peptidoglycan/LPS O-acetylase OafA/YrhL
MKYRADIDGLRALAVVPVILFHAGFESFSGGFVGVDIFFVISGYLITTILIEDLQKGRFSIINFYERRARRILPALFFVMFVSVPFAWMWMLPSQLKDFSESLIAVSLFASNILFWTESNYFAGAAEAKPLLHTWSLAVEEQFYLLFPLFLLFAWRFGKNRVFLLIIIFTMFSLALSEWGWRNSPTANFYFSITRAWELFFGSIAAFIVSNRGVRASESASFLGLAAILFSIFIYDETTPFPSLYSIVPVAGVTLIILYAHKNTFTAKILSSTVLVKIGLISYSVYLWHQPLFAFARIKTIESPGGIFMGSLSLLAILLGMFSWRYIEQPFRKSLSRASIFKLSITTTLIIIALGTIGVLTDGYVARFAPLKKGDITHDHFFQHITEDLIANCESSKAITNIPDNTFCVQTKSGEPDWLLLGDSYAAHLLPGMIVSNPSKNILLVTSDNLNVDSELFKGLFNYISKVDVPKTILLSLRYSMRFSSKNELFSELTEIIELAKRG